MARPRASMTNNDAGHQLDLVRRGSRLSQPIEPPPEPERVTEDVPPNEDGRGRSHGWMTRAQEYRADLERRPRIGFLLRSFRRYGAIEGKHLSLVIAMNLFVAIIPLIILGYAFIEAFNPHRSFGDVVVHAFHLSGDTAQTVKNTFSTASSGKTTALSISIIFAVDHRPRCERYRAARLCARIRRDASVWFPEVCSGSDLVAAVARGVWWEPCPALSGRWPSGMGSDTGHPDLPSASVQLLYRDASVTSRPAICLA